MNIFELISNTIEQGRQYIYGDIGKNKTEDELFQESVNNMDLSSEEQEIVLEYHNNDKQRLLGNFVPNKQNIQQEKQYHTDLRQIL
jgi:hypothetical protein